LQDFNCEIDSHSGLTEQHLI